MISLFMGVEDRKFFLTRGIVFVWFVHVCQSIFWLELSSQRLTLFAQPQSCLPHNQPLPPLIPLFTHAKK